MVTDVFQEAVSFIIKNTKNCYSIERRPCNN